MKTRLLIIIGIIFLLSLASFEQDAIYAQEQNPNIRIDDSTFERQSLQTGETISPQGHLVSIIIESLGAGLIVVFIVIYAIKKKKGVSKHDNN